MPSFRTSRTVRHSAADMFVLVADVEAYPQFLPLCKGLRVRKRSTSDDGLEMIVADMDAGYKAIRETFTSKVTLDQPNLRILVEYIDGPFRRLQNHWMFRDTATGEEPQSVVEFFIDYEFRSRTLGFIVGSVFDAAFRRFSEAFERRADAVYGRDRRTAASA